MFSEKDVYFTKVFIGSYIFVSFLLFYTIFEVKKKIWPKPKSKILHSALSNTVTTFANISYPANQ